MAQPINIEDFDKYIRQGEPDKKEKAYIWQTAIGLQDVDGLKTSDYLRETARRNIEGEISADEVSQLIKSYYLSKTQREPDDDEKEEADQAASNINKILSARTLNFSTQGYISLHRRIFEGVFKHAGKIRDYDITKKEWVLNGDTVNYLNNEDLRRALNYDIEQERQFSYKGLSTDEMIAHIPALSLDFGRYMPLVRATHAPRQSLPFSIYAPSDLTSPMTCLPNIRGISVTHLYGPTTRTLVWGLIIRPFIWSGSSEICCWANNGICETDTCTFKQPKSGRSNPDSILPQAPNKHRTSRTAISNKYRTSSTQTMSI